jgi:hypothetical protein
MNISKISLLMLSLLFSVFIVSGQTIDEEYIIVEGYDSTLENLKVAFIGDQGLSSDSKAVLQLIKDEDADMVLHQGDFDYEHDPNKWDQQINDILGPNFPYFASVGNHDIGKWLQWQQRLTARYNLHRSLCETKKVNCIYKSVFLVQSKLGNIVGVVINYFSDTWEQYQKILQDRLDRIEGASCVGDLGVKSACVYKGLFFVLSGVGTMGSDHENYIKDQLASVDTTWKICSWHKNQRLMQVGEKVDEVGWQPYEECRKAGAMIVTGHKHAYSRTHLMDNFETQSVASTTNTLEIEKGKTFVAVSGIAGHSISGQDNELATKPWWASIYTSDQNANHGALFCTFNENRIENKAHCYFKNIDKEIIDEFDIINNLK